jgi:hypothetical protein
MTDRSQFSLRLSPEFRDQLEAHAGGNRKMADAVRNAVRFDMLLSDRYGINGKGIITSVLERADPDDVVDAMIALRTNRR